MVKKEGLQIKINGQVAAVWMRGSWYHLVNGDYDVVTDKRLISLCEAAVLAEPETARGSVVEWVRNRLKSLDQLRVLRTIHWRSGS